MGWGSSNRRAHPIYGTGDPKKPHIVKTSFWGNQVFCDPKTGKPLKDQKKVKDEGLKKPGWF